MAFRRLNNECKSISIQYIYQSTNKLHHRHYRLASKAAIPKDIASHIEQLKSIASETNKQHILPSTDKLITKSKKKSSSSKNGKFIDKYSFNFNQSKSEQKKIRQKEKLSKILQTMHSKKMPLSQGRTIDSPSHFDLSIHSESDTINEATSKLPPNLQDILSKFTEVSTDSSSVKPSIPIPSIQLDETFDFKQHIESNTNSQGINFERIPINQSNYENISTQTQTFDEDERMEQDAMKSALEKHQNDINELKIGLFNESEYDLREQIDIKRRERLNGEREHFYIKSGKSTFSDIGVSDILCERLKEFGYKCPSMIQSLFIKQYHSLSERNKTLIMGAETGSGKTLAFLIPIIDEYIEEYAAMNFIQFDDNEMAMKNMKVDKQKMPFLKYPKCVIIEPYAELCSQIQGVVQSIIRPFGLRVECWNENHCPPPMHCLYDYLYSHYDENDENRKKIESAPEILIVTPAVFKHVFDVRFILRLQHLVIDEADIMLTHKSGQGHWCHIEQILQTLQTYQKDKLLSGFHSNLHQFSSCLYIFTGATLANKRVQVFLGKHGQRSKAQKKNALPDSLMKLFKKSIWVCSSLQHRHSPNLTQKWLFARDNLEQQELLLRALHRHPAQKARYKRQFQSFPPISQTIIFCNSKNSVDEVNKFLRFHKIPCCVIHEGIAFEKREQTLHSFYYEKKVPILVCTDMMSRGYDFGGSNVECVIQCDFAKTPDIHYNRVGRTARAGRKGLAINLYMGHNANLVKELVKITNNEQRIDGLYKTKIKQKLTQRAKKKLKSLGIEPPLSVREQNEKMGIKPKKKHREFKFFAVQQRKHDKDEKKK